MVYAKHALVLGVGLEARSDPFFGCRASWACSWEGTIVYVFEERNTRRINPSREVSLGRRIGTNAIAVGAIKYGNDGRQILGIQGVVTTLPVLATERANGQVQLHSVVVLAVAAENLPLAVFMGVPSRANSRSDFITPSELNGLVDAPSRL